jgi:hypothetical protein
MFDYLQKYNNLPKEVRDKMSTPAVMSAIESLEKEYGFSLAAVAMKAAVKDIDVSNLDKYLTQHHNLEEEKSKRLSNELKEKVFFGIADYLGIKRPADTRHKKMEDSETLPVPPVREASYHFSPEDAKEVKELAQKINGYIKGSSVNDQIEEKLNDIVSKIQINFGSQLLSGRFRNILKTYLSGIRDRLETKQTLTKPLESGGLGFDVESAEKVLLIADGDIKDISKVIDIKPPKKISVPEDKLTSDRIEKLKSAGVRDIEYDLSSLERNKKVTDKIDTDHELAPPPPTRLQGTQEARPAGPKPPTRQGKAPAKWTEKTDLRRAAPSTPAKDKFITTAKQSETKPASPKITTEFRTPIQTGGKIKMEDVKFQPKIMGPIDELRYMSLVNFRRLDEDPLKAVIKIKEKIDILEEEYSKKLEGIKAWRLCPVNRLYLKMGEASISKKRPINDIIEERKSRGKDYLNNREFEAIIKLNKELRF